MKREILKVSKLINKQGYIPFMNGNKILFVVNKITGKEYKPKHELVIL